MAKHITAVLLALFAYAPRAEAISLAEYGVSLTATGLVDHVTQLRWLDSGITEGGLDELQGFLDAGWRLATEAEFSFLASRDPFDVSGFHESDLHPDDFVAMMTRLSVDLGDGFAGAWVCRPYGAPEDWCTSTTSFGGQFVLDGPYGYDTSEFGLHFYITEVPIYGAFDCDDTNDYCTYMGRSLLVRPVPLPAAVWLLTAALFSAALARRAVAVDNA